MSGSAAIAVYPLPTVYTVTGGGSYCAGGSGVHINLSGSDAGVNYQLYNSTTPVGTPVAGTGVAGTLDLGLQTATGTYTVVATNGTTACSSNMTGSTGVSITPTVTPSVTIASSNGDTICAGSITNFSASIVNGGTAPVYTWLVDGTPVSAASTFSFAPADGQIVSVTITSNALCPSGTASDAVTMSVLPNLAPSVTIGVAPGDTVCQGTMVTFSATSVNGGTAPHYEWRLNGSTIVSTGITYTMTPNNGDAVICLLNSNYRCRTDTVVLSNTIGMVVQTPTLPIVSIIATEGQIAGGFAYVDSFTAVVSNGGTALTYQWSINGIEITGATGPLLTQDIMSANDVVSVVVTNHSACGSLPGSSQVVVPMSSEGVKVVSSSASDIKLVPNPNKGTFTVKGTLGITTDEEVTLEITNMIGQVIYNSKVIAHNGTINEKIQLSNTIANGMYMLSVHSGSENTVFHMVIEQ